MLAIGLVDDIKPVNWKKRLGCHILISAAMIFVAGSYVLNLGHFFLVKI